MTPNAVGSFFLILFGLIEIFLRRGKTAKSFQAGADDHRTTVLVVAAYLFSFLALSINLPGPAWLQGLRWGGVGCSALGTALRIWSMRTLGRFYTRTLVTTSEQRVVQRGPYRFIRHPGYLASILIWVGASVASGSVIATVLVFVLLVVAYIYRIRNEERMLVQSLGQAYTAYQGRSWRLVPLLY